MRSTLRENRLGGGLLSAAGSASWLTSTLNCRSRSARLRGAAGSAATSRLAVPSDVPFQASGAMPPVGTVRKPLGWLSNAAVWAAAVWANTGKASKTARPKAATRMGWLIPW